MPHKIRKTKGVTPHKNKTDRTLIPTEIRYAMVSDKAFGMTDLDIGRKHNKNRRQVLRTITKAKERARRDNRLLLDPHNVQETPKKWGRKRAFAEVEKKNIVSEVISTHAKRVKTAEQWVKDLDLPCLDTTFTRIIYEYRLHYFPGGENPELNPECMYKRNQLAEELLSMDFRQCVFIDKANERSEYSKESCWHSPEEYLHPDMKQKTQKQDYSKAEFISAIKWGEPPGPHRVFKTETLEEKKEAEVLINKMRKEQLPRLRAEFDAQEAEKDICFQASTLLQLLTFRREYAAIRSAVESQQVSKSTSRTIRFVVVIGIKEALTGGGLSTNIFNRSSSLGWINFKQRKNNEGQPGSTMEIYNWWQTTLQHTKAIIHVECY
jgi:hypothetical protein